MDETQKADMFKDCLRTLSEVLAAGGNITPEQEFDLYDRLIENWHEPTAKVYNRMVYNPHPDWIMSQPEFVATIPEGTVHVLFGLPALFFRVDKNEVWQRRLKWLQGKDNYDD